MIILKASTDLKVIFNKLINTMGINHKWTELFLIKNNNLILHGKSTILVFDFGTKAISCNTAEVTLVEEKTQQITDNELLVNVINMTLYTFGKWGKIKGLTVEKDYQQINSLFGNFLKQINVEPILTDDNLKFVRNGILITYEEIIELILKEQIQKEDGTENSEIENIDKDKIHNKYDIGLWRKIVWTSGHYAFEKEKLTEYDKMKARIGNNFYRVSYLCPVCKDKLYMVVYPYGKELLIESDEKGIYLARAYTCTTCHQLFTPKPHMLLIDGSVFALDFEDDSEAYADYIELIGKQGEKSSNCNFNEYEVDYFKSKKNGEEQLEAICTDMELLSDKEVVELQDKMDSGFYPKESTNKFYQAVENVLISRRYPKQEKDYNLNEIKKHKKSKLTIETVNENKTQALTNRLTKERRHKLKGNKKRKSIHKVEKPVKIKPNYILQYNTDRKQVNNQLHESMRKQTLISSQNLRTNSSINIQPILSDLRTDLTIKDNIVGNAANKNKVTELLQKVESCKDKNYIHIHRVFEDLKKADYNYSIKEPFIISLKDMMEKQGKRELDALRLKIPANISKAQYLQLNETIEQYKEIDYSSYKKHLDTMRVEAEKQEIVSYIKRANARDRSTYMSLYQKLKTEDFDENNVKPFLENIYDKIYNMDEKTIYTICHDPANLTFEEGLEALEEISLKDLLPELKSKTLETIEQRLTKIKRNECEKLVSKISKEMDKIKINNTRIHYYDVRSGVRSNHNDEESKIINKALNSFAESRGRYEFPILICDASVKANGTSGFVLTPDHIFYNSLFESGVIDIMKIDNIIAEKGMINFGLYAYMNQNRKVKLSNSLQLSDLKQFATVLNEFITYLKEKPESRDISYIAKEKHTVKCCYRCGFVYKGDNLCPKCGSKMNE